MTTMTTARNVNTRNYSYKAALEASSKINWRVEDLIGEDKPFDSTRPFMPEGLARTGELDFLNPLEKLKLNQIRGHAYLSIFGLVEEFILPFVLNHTGESLGENDHRTRALLEFAGEEAKHIHLFREFRNEFESGFPARCDVIGPADAVGKAILAHDPLGVALAILHIEWMTQSHYVESVRDADLDPQFKSLLKHHWLEECQHAKLDTLMVESIALGYGDEEVARGIADYMAIGTFIDNGLKQQVEFDLDALERSIGRKLSPDEKHQFRLSQLQANRYTYLGSGMTHPNFLETMERLQPGIRAEVEAAAPSFM